MEKNTLNGFEAIFDTLNPNVGSNSNTNEDTKIETNSSIVESLTDKELEEIRKSNNRPNNNTKVELTIVEELEDVIEEEPAKSNKKSTKKEETNTVIENEDTIIDNTDNENEEDIVLGFFDSLSEKLGWELDEEDEKPKTADELIEYFQDVIEENSVPLYASEEIAKLDEFVKNGGNIRDYFEIDKEIDIDNIDIEDNEDNQKSVVKYLLKELGFSLKYIDKKISKYEDAGLLADEAEDALEAIKGIVDTKKELLLTEQQKSADESKKRQQEFFDNVVTEIKTMDSLYGIKVPQKDKKDLLDFIFKPDSNGMTRYQKEYSKSLKNLITSAYFTMKGQDIVNIAKNEGTKTAISRFKNSLNKNSGINKQSKKDDFETDDTLVWNQLSRQIRQV